MLAKVSTSSVPAKLSSLENVYVKLHLRNQKIRNQATDAWQFYYPDIQPNLVLWEPVEPKIEMTRETYDFLCDLLHGLAADLPYNQRVRQALEKLEAVRIFD